MDIIPNQTKRRLAAGKVTLDGAAFDLAPRDGLYVPMGTKDVMFQSTAGSEAARFYVVSTPAHARYEPVKISIDKAVPLWRKEHALLAAELDHDAGEIRGHLLRLAPPMRAPTAA